MVSQRIIVVGGVAAGPAAAAAAKRTDPDAEVILYEEGRDVSYGACEMPYLLSGEVAEPADLVVLSPDEMNRTRGVQVRTLHRVESVDAATGRVTVRDLATGSNRSERFDKLILATGASSTWPDIPDLAGPEVSGFRTLGDAARVTAWSRSGTARWLVMGGGYIGLEVADRLADSGHRVTLLAPSGPLGGRVSAPVADAVTAVLQSRGVALRRARAVGVRRKPPGAPIAIRSDDGELVGADRIVVATGSRPNVALAADSGLKLGQLGGIAVDEGGRSSNSRIWACGDCIEVKNLVSGQPALTPLSQLAFRTARVAGHNAARRGRQAPKRFEGTVGAYALKVGDLEVSRAGLSESEARDSGFDPVATAITHSSRATHMPGRAPLLVHLVADRGSHRLLGVQICGSDGAALRVNAVVPVLRARGTVKDLYDQDYIYAPPFAPSLDPLIVAAGALQKILSQ